MIEINRHILPNGLRVVHNRNAATQMATVNLLYRVGSKNEDADSTGLAHLLEHLMFGGSENAPDFDRKLQNAGGECNAWTNSDITNYYETVPSYNIETALWLESDRMQNLLLTDKSLEVQRSVVMEEFKQRCLNTPYGDSGHHWRKIAYKEHPYRWPVIGEKLEHIENVTAERVRSFYRSFYSPDNAILSIVGNMGADEAFRLAEKWFGDIPASGFVHPALPVEPVQTEARSLRVAKDVPHDMLVRIYHMCDRMHADYQTCDLLSDVLSNGRSSRFYRNILMRGNLVSSVDASITGDIDAGVLIVKAHLLPGVGYKAVEGAIDAEIDAVLSGKVDAWEIEKNVNRFESNALFTNINNDDRAANLGYYEALGDVEMINSEVGRYRQITPKKLAEVAAAVLRPENCTTLYYESNRK